MKQINLPIPAYEGSIPVLTKVAEAAGTKSVFRAAAVVRPVSTLNPDPRFNLTPAQRRQGFFYLYYGLTKARRVTWTWMSLITACLFPALPQRAITPGEEKKFKSLLQEHGKQWTAVSASLMTSVTKDASNETFRLRVPLMVFNSTVGTTSVQGALTSAAMCLKPAATPEEEPLSTPEKVAAVVERLHSGVTVNLAELQLPTGASLDAKDLKALQDCGASLKISRFAAGFDVAELTITMDRSQVEYLTNTEWMAVRPLDVYGPIFEWVDTQYGRFGRAPAFSLPLKKIASSIQSFSREEATPRLSQDGLMVDEHGTLMWLPENLTDINRFEDAMNAAYQQPNGEFTAVPSDSTKPAAAPPSMPVLIDWVNLKFSYTTLTGRLNIKNLDRTYVANASHFFRFNNKKLGEDGPRNFISMVYRMADFYGVQRDGMTVDALSSEVARLGNRRDAFGGAAEIPLSTVVLYAEPVGQPGSPEFHPFSPACRKFLEITKEVLSKIAASPETAYSRYSVLTILELRAQLIAFTVHCKDPKALKEADLALRSSYVNQGEDPDFKLEPVPYVQDQLGMMPHQVKVANVTRDRPNHIFLPVDAGGGKTMIGIYDLLREIANGEVGPFVIMCPAHLVAQYVKELVYATNGRMNCVPITTYTIRRQGFDRLKAMITSAPINFCLVVDYDVIDLGSKSMSYGVAPVKVFPVIEFVRQFSPKYVFCDEAHMLRNESSRQSATNRLIADIPKKRMASGTMVANTILDLARQMALMDPTVFGTTDDFIAEYALEVRGSKVIQWKPRAELAVRQQMRENAVLAEARRKEWAAILPYPKERFHSADLTPAQQEVYKQILKQTIEDLQKKMEENEKLRLLFAPPEDGEDVPEESYNTDKLLKPFLARLERFLTAPGKDPLGKVMLSGDDTISPKARKVVEICREHIDQNLPGKVLIFTSYEFSAQAVYEALQSDPVLKDLAIYYTADRKEECGADFEKNDSKKILVGIEFSMNTGLNLQFASRLIRLESVWTPGVLEQGNSRIGRPNLKDKESRPYVYYDWIIANRTIDVTKASYLMAKTISKAKFDEAGNPRFDDLEVPALLSMTLDTIAETNDFNESLRPYFDKYAAYKKALFAEYDEYREKNKEKLFAPDGTLKLTKVERAPNPQGSKLMLRVPYVPGMEVYSGDKLGLVRYDAFMRLNLNEEDESEADEGEGEGDNDEADSEGGADPQLEAERQAAAGLAVHTDRGDGTIVRVNKATLQVELPSGERIKVRKMASFIITRANTSSTDVRTQLLKMAGDVPIDAPVEVLETKLTDRKRRQLEKQQQKEQKEEPIPALDLEFTVVNDYLGLRVTNFADDERISSILQGLGFKYSAPYFAAHVPTAQHLLNLAKKWQAEEFSLDKENSEWLRAVYLHMKASRKTAVNFFGIANQSEISNFYRMEFKPNPDDKHINPFPLIQDDQLYVALPARGQPGSKRAIREARVPSIKWFEYEAGSELLAFTPSKAKASAVIQKLLSMGLEINNLEKLKKQFSKLRIARDVE